MSVPILQSRLPAIPWMDPRLLRLPGILPLEDDSWLVMDEAFAGQMAERDRLIAGQPEAVSAMMPGASLAVEELWSMILDRLARTPGYEVGPATVLRPDGVTVALDRARPMLTLGRLVQEDLCLLQRQQDEHVLTAALLCFPASWTLAEKFGHPLVRIHVPVSSYDGDLARRVQRLFDAVRPERSLWRMNYLVYRDPTLHQPRREGAPRVDRTGGQFVRSERQCLVRLPQSGAVLFSIHTYLLALASLSDAEQAALAEAAH